MSRTRELVLSSSILVVASCGRSTTSPSATASAGAADAPMTTSTTGSASGSSSPTGPAASADEAEPKLPPIEIGTPSPQKLGGRSITGEVCKTNGPVMKDPSFAKAIGELALGADGSIFVLDDAREVRKYLANAGGTCELTLDPSFGDGGVLAVGEGGDQKPDTLVSDAAGDVYVSGWTLAPTKIAGGKIVGEVCDRTGRLHVAPSGDAGTMEGRKLKLERGGKCTAEDVRASGSWDPKINLSLVLPFGDGLAFVGQEGAATKIGLAGADGRVRTMLGAGDGEEEICSLGAVARCGLGVCVMDANCRHLRVWNDDGAWIGAGELGAMTGLRYPWPVGFAVGKGVAYMSMSGAPKDDRDDESYGVIVRVTGLD
jgi:hypothetical protein